MCLSMNKIPKQKNVLGEDIEPCSMNPVTGWFRDGSCNTDKTDVGVHCVCAKVNNDFLNWCKENGNDLITPHPEFGFEGLKDGVSKQRVPRYSYEWKRVARRGGNEVA